MIAPAISRRTSRTYRPHYRAVSRATSRATLRAARNSAHSSAHHPTARPTMFAKASCASSNGVARNELRPHGRRARGSEAREWLRRQQREEAAGHLFTGWDHIRALQERLAEVGFHAVAEGVDDCRAARSIRLVLVAPVHHQGVMERRLAGLEFDRDGFELSLLRRAEHGLHSVHVAGEAGDRQQLP